MFLHRAIGSPAGNSVQHFSLQGLCVFKVAEVVKTFDPRRVSPETLDEFRYEMLHSVPPLAANPTFPINPFMTVFRIADLDLTGSMRGHREHFGNIIRRCCETRIARRSRPWINRSFLRDQTCSVVFHAVLGLQPPQRR